MSNEETNVVKMDSVKWNDLFSNIKKFLNKKSLMMIRVVIIYLVASHIKI